MRKQFVWEPWHDPISPEEINQYDKLPFHDNDDDYIKTGGPMVHTPFGFLMLNEHNKASNRFDFWVLHTNFDITEETERLIDTVPGVETLEVFTRYRMRIGFPRSGLFDVATVRKHIEEILIDSDQKHYVNKLIVFDADVVSRALEACKDLSRTADYWGIYVLPNGNISIVTAKKQSDYPQFMEQLRVFEAAQQLVGGQVLSSE